MMLWGLLIMGLPLGRGEDIDLLVPSLRNMESFIMAMRRLDSDGLPCDTLRRSDCLSDPLALSLLHLSNDPGGVPHLELGQDAAEHLSEVEKRISELRWKNLPLSKLSRRQGHLLHLLLSFGPFLSAAPPDRIAFAEAFLRQNVPNLPAHLKSIPSRRIYFLLEAALQEQSAGLVAPDKSILAASLLPSQQQQQQRPPTVACPEGESLPPEWIASIAAKAPPEPSLIRTTITSRLCSAHSPSLRRILQEDPSTAPERALQPFLDAHPEVAFSDRHMAMVYRQAKRFDRAAHLQLLAELPIIEPSSSLNHELYARYAAYIKEMWERETDVDTNIAVCTGLCKSQVQMLALMYTNTAQFPYLETCRTLSWGMSVAMPSAHRQNLLARIIQERVDPSWQSPSELLYQPLLADHTNVALMGLGAREPIEALLKSTPETDKVLRLKLLFRVGDDIAGEITLSWEVILEALTFQLTGLGDLPPPLHNPETAKQLIQLMLTKCDLRRPEEFARAFRALRTDDPDDSLRQCLGDPFFSTPPSRHSPSPLQFLPEGKSRHLQEVLHSFIYEGTGIAITTPMRLQFSHHQFTLNYHPSVVPLLLLVPEPPLELFDADYDIYAPNFYQLWLEYLCPLQRFKVPTMAPDLRLIWHRLMWTHWTCAALSELLGQINAGPGLTTPRRQPLIEQLVSKHAAADATRLAQCSLSYLQIIAQEPVDSPLHPILLAQPATRLFLAMPLYGPILQRILEEDSDTRKAYLNLPPLDLSPASADLLLPLLDAAFQRAMSPTDVIPELAPFKPIPPPSARVDPSTPPRTAWQVISNIFFYGIPLTTFLTQPDHYESLFRLALSYRQPPRPPIPSPELIRRTIEEGLNKSWADFEQEYGRAKAIERSE